MAKKQVGCKDLGITCDFVSTEDTKEEVISKMSEHAASVHEIPSIPSNLAQKLEESIRDVE